MVRLEQLAAAERKFLLEVECPIFNAHPWVDGPPLDKRRVAIISTAGLHTRGDRPFTREGMDYYRVIPGDIKANDLVMTHISVNFDRGGFQQDWNVVFPLERLQELAEDGVIGSVASLHYSFMGAHNPMQMEKGIRAVAKFLKKDGVNAALLVPV